MNTQDIIKDYQSGQSLNKVSNKYSLSVYKLKKLLLKNNIKIRNRKEQNILSNQERGKKVNHTFFDTIDTKEKAYLLGFLAADGNVSNTNNRIKLGLSSVDREILERIKILLDVEKEILDYQTSEGYNVSELNWSSMNQKVKLAKYDIVPNKTYKKISIKNVPNEFIFSYILGYYDGDGCFRNDGNYCRFEICAFSPYLLKEISEIINKKIGSDVEVKKAKSRKDYYTITYSTRYAIAILDFLYDDNNFYLKRKYDKYLQWKAE